MFLLIFSILIIPKQIFAHNITSGSEATGAGEIVDVNAVFWPIVPGTTVADPLFFLKQLKESFGGFFKSGNINQSGYQIELSEKRLVEANKLVENQDFSNALKSFRMNESNRNEAVRLKKKAVEEKTDVNELTLKLVKSLENQQKALAYLSTQFPEDQHPEIDEMVNNLTLQISEAK